METFIQHAMISWATTNSTVMALLMTGTRVNPAAVKRETDPYDFLLITRESGDTLLQEDWSAQFSEEVLQAGCVQEGKISRYRIFLANATRLNITVLTPEDAKEILEKDTLAKVLYDPNEEYANRENPNDLSQRSKKPTSEEYDLWCQQFFANITDVALALTEEEEMLAQAALGRAREALLAMTSAAVASDSSFHINVGNDGQNLRAYMSEVEYDHLARSYAPTEKARLWDALFQSCMLFRKAGLKLNELDDFTYPKRLDVEMLRYLRKTWEETR